MAEYKALFKSQSIVLSPRNHNKLNRDRLRVERAKKREERFQSNRKMDKSPSPNNMLEEQQKQPQHEDQTANTAQGNQENQNPVNNSDARKQIYLQRYIKWKAENKQKAAPLETRQAAATTTAEVFVPPKRRSLYVVLDTKSNKTTEIKAEKILALEQPPAKVKPTVKPIQVPTVKPIGVPTTKPTAKPIQVPTVRPIHVPTAKPIQVATVKPIRQLTATKASAIVVNKPKPAVAAVVKKPWQQTGAVVKQQPLATARQPQPLKKPMSVVRKPVTRPTPAPATAVGATTAIKASKPTNLMTQPFERPTNTAKIVKPLRGGGVGGGAAGKFKTTAPIKTQRSQALADLSTRMKVKKEVPVHNKQKMIEKRANFKQELLQIASEEQLPDTPIEILVVENPFQAQATSTQCRNNNSSQDLLEAYRDITQLSPVSVNEQPKTVKRQLIPPATKQQAEAAPKPEEETKKRFNFVRYSEANSLIESPTPEAQSTLMPQESDCPTEDKTIVAQTPPPSSARPNYLSPYVSVSRGKVNSHTERQKRNSMYLQDEKQPETPVAVRRTLESVHYFRMQLDSEIRRLHALCDEWDSYSGQHEERLAESGGKDMIDAAIGQTKLLTSKKLMQFSGLIDRCEAGATGVGLRPNDGSEATKPVMAEDLEGWWDMMRLQSDNVDKRFNNLVRWKANDWQDPDAIAVAPKPKTKAKAKPKVAAKASSNIKSFLRKALAEKRKADAAASDQQTTSVETPKKRIIVVRDRKSFSPARTVLRLSVGSSGRRSSGSSGRPSIGGNTLLKSALLGAAAAEEKARQATPPSPPAPLPVATPKQRMSILKTPGTKKRESGIRGVVFSAKKKVRRFQFTVEEGNVSSDDDDKTVHGVDKLEDCEEDMSMEKSSSLNNQTIQNINAAEAATPEGALRTCVLRSRRVRMRPSSEFM
ncbi:LOW QUALITY PROTEIN: guanylate kinase-associated protein mars [Drosophila nasuta]|uniref:LOW QUALITY PROTEIN: guanylate kinase-associated protein mars n=1 Tax=Drosophila nasuta TaxID=42062 RepID=UPI00295E34A0|nr:LOW QUALITY PROTEIN: guanylate kinase-associated protein mars [Drosophila nasuta]